MDYGFEAVISPRFGDIFRNNCTKNGLVPVQVPAEVGDGSCSRAVEADPTLELTIDVERRTVSAPALGLDDDVPARRRRPSTGSSKGLDDIGITLRYADDITAFEATRPQWLPTA